MVRFDHSIEIRPRHLEDVLVRCAEALEDHRCLLRSGIDSELDVRQHPLCMGVSHQQGAPLSCGVPGEGVSVDEAHTLLDRVDPEARPGHIEKRQRRDEVDDDPRVGAEVCHRPLEHEWRTGNRVEHGFAR